MPENYGPGPHYPTGPTPKDKALAKLAIAENNYEFEKLNLDTLVSYRSWAYLLVVLAVVSSTVSGILGTTGLSAFMAGTITITVIALIAAANLFYFVYREERICTDPRYEILGTDYYGPKIDNAKKRELAARQAVNKANQEVINSN